MYLNFSFECNVNKRHWKREDFCVFNEFDFVYTLHMQFFLFVLKNRVYSHEERKRFVVMDITCFLHNFQTWYRSWCRLFTLLSTDVCFLISYFCCSFISVSKKQNTERILNSSQFIQVAKVQQSKSKKKVGVGVEYVTGQSNSLILQYLLRRVYCLNFALSQKS